MPRITNKYNLPQPVVDAVTFNDYDKGDADFSVTQLSRPPLQVRLYKEYDHTLEEDASSKLWALLGTAVHNILERAACHLNETGGGDYTVEDRKYGQFGPWKIGGKQDLYTPEERKVSDYKVTSLYAVRDGLKKEWVEQLNALACLHRMNDQPVERAEIVLILRDFSPSNVQRAGAPFKVPIVALDAPVWPDAEARQYIMNRCSIMTCAMEAADINLITPCTPDECWEKPTTYAVKKRGNKRAIRVKDSIEEAEAYLEQYLAKSSSKKKSKKNPTDYYIETRPGQRTRCESFCLAKDVCWVYQKWLAEQGR